MVNEQVMFETSIFERDIINLKNLEYEKFSLNSVAFKNELFVIKSFLSKNRAFVDGIVIRSRTDYIELSINENEYLVEVRKNDLISSEEQKLIDQELIQFKEFGYFIGSTQEVNGFIKINYKRYLENLMKRNFYSNSISSISMVEANGILKIFQQSEKCQNENISDNGVSTSFKENYYLPYAGRLNCLPAPNVNFVGQIFPMQIFDKKFAIIVAAPEKIILASISKVIYSINILLLILIIVSFYFYIRFRQVEIKSHEERRRYDAQLAQSSRLSLLGEMASGVAHEINNPLTVIINSLVVIKKNIESKSLNEELLLKYIEKIENTTFRITKIINGLRSFSRDGSNDQFVEVSLVKVISETLDLATEKIKKNEIELSYHIPNSSFIISGSEVQLGQVILNIISNAIDAIETQSEKWIQIEVIEVANKFQIKISNSGVKISKELADKIMQPFFTTKPVGKGTGLGLSISFGIMQKHKGNLFLDMNHQNTCFILEFSKNL